MKTLPFIIALIFMISSCKKTEVQKEEIKYEIISSTYGPMTINYNNEFGNTNTEDYTGSSWTKTIDASKANQFYVDCSQDVHLPVGTHTITVRVYYNGEVVDEVTNDETTTADLGAVLFGSAWYHK
jgi:hypothetical protein